ncbi:hypothetical protein CkaCkLH20_09572 [Colletotrichum karsti]|uniref:Secreted protein n=1 Tax=Colletotrichum karsti TaxID=1095194 RepID=A0A9P6LHZ3_9PEZI|nr:uncharacterized protein CkaCkLH20_09572 [Colletotrichum karsti]KAF9873062.1 hypothetical protein CkaCkLH20_09572 [Colletotrichum karsti]
MRHIGFLLGILELLASSCQARSHSQVHDDFVDPPSTQRPRFRYWLPDGSIDVEAVKSDITSAGSIGSGGVEFLPFYNYGGSLGPPPEGVDWSTAGFGTPAHVKLFLAALEAHQEAGLRMDFSFGPNQGQGVPAHPSDEGLQWDLFAETRTIAGGNDLNGTIPGWGTGELVAAVSAVVLARTNVTQNVTSAIGMQQIWWEELVLKSNSLRDITPSISPTGEMNASFLNASSGEPDQELFFFYQKLSGNKNLEFESESNETDTIWDNGSYVVDHFSAAGALTVRDFWEQHMFVDNIKDLLMEVGHYGWEDSMEIRSNISWTRTLPERFLKKFGYRMQPYLPLIMFANNNINLQSSEPGHTRCFLDTEDRGQGYVNDYRAALAEGYQEYLATLSEWLHTLGLELSAQVSYNMPMDMEASIPFADAPECESLQWRDNVDGYRQFSGPANLARRNVISNELGAVFGRPYSLAIPELLFMMNRAVSGGVNQFVIHGQAYSGNYPQTTWPGYTAFRYYVSDLYSPKRPDWDNGLKAALNYMARVQHIQQKGIPRTDVAFYNKQSVSDPNAATIYHEEDLVSQGWSYTYLSPDNFALPQAHVRDGLLAPDDARFKAMVVLGSQNLTYPSLLEITEFSKAGLPIILAGGTPVQYLSGSKTANQTSSFDAAMKKFILLENVYQVDEGDIAAKLGSLGLQPRVGVRTNGTWYTTWREEPTRGAAYAYVFGDTRPASGEIIVQSLGAPHFLDPWTGTQEPVLHYRTEGLSTVIPLGLTGNQTKIIGFLDDALEEVQTPGLYATELSADVLGQRAEKDAIIFHVAASASSTIVLSSGRKVCHQSAAPNAFNLNSWQLVLEHWEAPEDMTDAATVAIKRNTTHELEDLISWTEIPAATNTSGIGYYSANFTWPPASAVANNATLGAYIQFSPALNAITLEVNEVRLHHLDPTDPVADITEQLVNGQNHVVAIVPSTMWNYVRSILPDIDNGGLSPIGDTLGVEIPKTENGLVGAVSIIPFEALRITI